VTHLAIDGPTVYWSCQWDDNIAKWAASQGPVLDYSFDIAVQGAKPNDFVLDGVRFYWTMRMVACHSWNETRTVVIPHAPARGSRAPSAATWFLAGPAVDRSGKNGRQRRVARRWLAGAQGARHRVSRPLRYDVDPGRHPCMMPRRKRRGTLKQCQCPASRSSAATRCSMR